MAKFQVGIPWGQLHQSSSGFSPATFALSGSLSGGYSVNWLAYGITPLLGGTVSKIRIYASAVAGTLGSSDLVCDIYSDSNGNPNTSLQSSSTVTTTPTGAAWVEFTGFSQALTVGTNYFLILRNANSSPTTNNITYSYSSTSLVQGNSTDPATAQTTVFTSTNSGSTWTRAASVGFFVIDYGGGSIEGFPVQSGTSGDPQIYSSREGGIKFTTPANSGLNVVGVCGVVAKVSSPTGDLRYRIYTGSSTAPTLLGTTVTRAPGFINTARNQKPLYFSTPLTIPASTVVRVVVSETTQSDTSGNRYNLEHAVLSSTDTGILLPYTVQPELTLSTDGGATFSDTPNRLPLIWLLLDANDPFPVSSSGGASSHTFIG